MNLKSRSQNRFSRQSLSIIASVVLFSLFTLSLGDVIVTAKLNADRASTSSISQTQHKSAVNLSLESSLQKSFQPSPNQTMSQLSNKEALALLLEEKARRNKYRKIDSFYPEIGPLRRELYPKHLQFFAGGKTHRERCFMAANRIGKTEGAGGYEFALHLTGQYPAWWPGRRYDRPVKARASGDTAKLTRDIVQEKLFGPPSDIGSGLIPKDFIVSTTSKAGVPGAIDTALIRNVNGGVSRLRFQSYDQKRIAYQGDEQDIDWFDEEPPVDIYVEGLMRTMTTNGMVYLTFTPLMGLSETVMAFLPGGKITEVSEGTKMVVMATWDDVPHLSEKDKKELWASIPPFQRDARSKGVPQLGAGAIFPVPESDIVIKDFPIPDHFVQAYGMDVGWNRTAGIWGALDREKDILYLTSEHYRGQAEPSVHAEGFRARGEWIPGSLDPAARGRGQKDGGQLMQDYIDLGLNLEVAVNGVESGLLKVWQRMSSGRLKVFGSCQNWLTEYRLYRRDEKGQVVKANDHLMDATRYLVMSGLDRAIVKPLEKSNERKFMESGRGNGWMGG